jgi:hypothetical protein
MMRRLAAHILDHVDPLACAQVRENNTAISAKA